MKLFVTGASGWIGAPTVRKLIAAGHEVIGLARSDEAASTVETLGAQVARGTLDDVDVLRDEATRSDGVIHLGFRHDVAFTGDFAAAADTDRRAIETFGEALAGTDRPLLIASGTLGLAPGRTASETDMPDPHSNPRSANAHTALALAERGVRSILVRFAPTVHGAGDHGFVATLVDVAREAGFSAYVGDGSNRWPAVHRDDAAELVFRAIENAPTGALLHATAEAGVELRAVAEAIGRQLDVPTRSIAASDVGGHFRFLSALVGLDAPASSALTRSLLDWRPSGPGLVEDLDAGSYTPPGPVQGLPRR
ncbi:MAG TPA: SDR family oxidoreductase [Mycobacteriales bacterium]|nr:SDR family oxidoreductase [Mycobacteriales bacterium]